MIKRVFIVERGQVDQHGDRIIIEGLKLPKGKIPITVGFQAHHQPVGIAEVYIEDGVVKANAEIHPQFIHLFPSVGIKPIEAADNDQGGVDMKQCELLALGVSPHPNMDLGIKKISDQAQVYRCNMIADVCMASCPSKEDKTKCPNVKLTTNG